MKIAVIGDSISEGIGRQKQNYCNLLEDKFKSYEFKNFSLTGTTIKYALDKKEEIISYRPDILIMCYGQVEALTRPNPATFAYKMIPKRYKGLGMIDPRALYTSKYPQRIFQKIDSFIRYNLKKILIHLFGYIQWVEIEEFERLYKKFINDIKPHIKYIVVLSTVNINDKYFPSCTNQFLQYNKVINKISSESKLVFIDIYKELSLYSYDEVFLEDHFHPSIKGYDVISNLITNQINDLRR
ncbi:SGNH/GDSL hydrolase family protein [Priestia megaterium]